MAFQMGKGLVLGSSTTARGLTVTTVRGLLKAESEVPSESTLWKRSCPWSTPLQKVCTTSVINGVGEEQFASRLADHIEIMPTPLARPKALIAFASAIVMRSLGLSFCPIIGVMPILFHVEDWSRLMPT